MNTFFNIRTRTIILFGIFLFSLCITLYISYTYSKTENAAQKELDQTLLHAAHGISAILGTHYHTIDKSAENTNLPFSNNSKEYQQVAQQLTEFGKALNIDVLRTMVIHDKQVKYTASNYAKADQTSNERRLIDFFSTNNDASDAIHAAFFTVKPIYEYSEGPFGLQRSVYVPMSSNDGTIYVVQATTYLSHYQTEFTSGVKEASLALLVFFIITAVFISVYLTTKHRNLVTDDSSRHLNHIALQEHIRNHPDLHLQLAIFRVSPMEAIGSYHGTDVADLVMKQFLDLLQERYSPEYLVYRISFDRAALLRKSNIADAVLISRFKLIDFSRPMLNKPQVHITVTLGFAVANKDLVYENACIASDQARTSRENIVEYTEALYEVKAKAQQQITMFSEIRDAFASDRFIPYYQPIIHIPSGDVIRYECLARIHDANGSVISPGAFLDVVGHSRLEGELTRVIFTKSAELFRHTNQSWSINITVQDMLDQDLTTYMKEFLLDYPNPQRITLELLETEGLDKLNEAKRFLHLMKTFGVAVYIDDFGIGYANISQTLNLKVDGVKIYGPLIQRITRDKNIEMFLKHVIGFAQEVGLTVVAKHVENKHTLDKLREIGISYVQGNYFAPPNPQPPEALLEAQQTDIEPHQLN